MAVWERDPDGDGFVGRTEELEVIAGLVEMAATGRPRVVWVEGEAGSGKTALVRRAVAGLPAGFTLFRVEADELAIDIPFELAGQLGALHTDSPFVAGMEILRAWSAAQDDGSLAVLVEDFHWADVGSRQALLAAVKRLDRDRVLVMITSRPSSDDGWDRFRMDPDRCRQVALSDFDVEEVAEMAAAAGMELTHRQAVRLHEHTQGHPLWVRTLLAELGPTRLRTVEGDLPAPRSLSSSVTGRLSELPADAQALAAAMAVINQRSPLSMVGRVAGLAAPVGPFDHLLSTGFVRWDPEQPGPPVEFAHPLYRQAVYQDLSPTRRRDLHRAVAGLLTPAAVLAHRVAAADGVDDGLADELEAAARREMESGTAAIGARNLLWASSLTGTPDQAERRLLQGIRALLDCGHTAQAADLRDQLEACADSPTRKLVLGEMDWELGDATSAERWLRQAAIDATAISDRGCAGWAWAKLAEVYGTQGRGQDTIDAAHQALALPESGPRAERLAWMCLATGEGLLHGAPAGLDRMRQRLPQTPERVPNEEANMLVTRGTLGMYAGRTTSAISDHRAVLRASNTTSIHQIARCHFQMATLLINSGDWDDALVHAHTASSIASDGQEVWIEAQCHAALATVLAYRGDCEQATHHITAAETLAASHESIEGLITARIAAAAVARSQSQPQRVIEILADLPAVTPMIGALAFWPTLVVAYVDDKQLDRAEDLIDTLERAAAARALDFDARLSSLRARLAVAQGRPEDALTHFDAALARFGPDDPYLERALTHHAHGQLLKAKGDRQPAVTELRTAHQMLSSVAADPFLAWVDADLAATGIRPPDKSRRSTLELTDRERDVAVLVAQGLSNPEVAEQLYISRKAVEYHLSNIFGKLGITSRKELRGIQL
jgi:DNA-binding CsgD family transcriptional regulator/tetratricopeptide (TPR) repeat protein